MATWSNQSQNAATFSNATVNSATFTNISYSTNDVVATAGLYYGFGCFTYSGVEILSSQTAVFTNEIIN